MNLARIPPAARTVLNLIPKRFIDNGCSMSPDSIIRNDIRWACRIHDWRYCTRCHRPGRLGTQYRRSADKELRLNLGAGLPWYVRWVRLVYHFAVRHWGDGDNAFDSCGIAAGAFCRHNMPMPAWMRVQRMELRWTRILEDV
jgi:hypothetical protein